MFRPSRQFTISSFFFLNDPAPTEFSTLPLPAALPISPVAPGFAVVDLGAAGTAADAVPGTGTAPPGYPRSDGCEPPDSAQISAPVATTAAAAAPATDRKSTRLNSSHLVISYAVFCLKK